MSSVRWQAGQLTGLQAQKKWWAVAESNCGHEAFQASALPTELTAHGLTLHIYIFSVKLSPLILSYLLKECEISTIFVYKVK